MLLAVALRKGGRGANQASLRTLFGKNSLQKNNRFQRNFSFKFFLKLTDENGLTCSKRLRPPSPLLFFFSPSVLFLPYYIFTLIIPPGGSAKQGIQGASACGRRKKATEIATLKASSSAILGAFWSGKPNCLRAQRLQTLRQ